MYHPPPSSPVLGISLFQIALVLIMPDVVHPPHSWSSFCLDTSHFHLHHLLHLISFIHLQNVSIPVEHGCLAFNVMFSTLKSLLISSVLSLSPIGTTLIQLYTLSYCKKCDTRFFHVCDIITFSIWPGMKSIN